MEPVTNSKPASNSIVGQAVSYNALEASKKRLEQIKALGLSSLELGQNTLVELDAQDKKLEQAMGVLEETGNRLDKHERVLGRIEVVEKVDDWFGLNCIIS